MKLRLEPKTKKCVYCSKIAEGIYSIHRDGFGIGPEVHLCNSCGGSFKPTCHEIWIKISKIYREERLKT